MKVKLEYILIVSLGLFRSKSFGHDQNVHQTITANAEASAHAHSSAYADFLDTIYSDFPRLPQPNQKGAVQSIVGGSYDEDYANQLGDVGGKRSYNHFYDPLDTTYRNGLSDIPPDIRGIVGTNSFAWASISNCVGIDFKSHVFGIGNNVGTSNIWSWGNARGYEWLGLTATNQLARQTNLDAMFRAVGQVMHLLEDASQPQHVRNEQHLDVLSKLFWESPIEDWGSANVTNLNYGDGSMLNWGGAGFRKLEDFWDRHRYTPGNATVLVDAEAGGAQLGLAEWCNGNFLGARHLFPEYSKPGDIEYYPFPSRNHSTDYSDVKSHPERHLHGLKVKNKTGQGVYLTKTGDGITGNYIARVNYLGIKIPNLIGVPYCSIDDSNVLHDYHNAFIPKAVKYSAGLLDYFFRGTMDVGDVKYDSDTGQSTCTAINTSGQDFRAGSLFIYDDDNGVRTLLSQTPLEGTWANHTSMTLTFPSPASTNDNLLLVYQGTIGWTNDSALDPVDAGIGIAAKKFTVQSEITTSGFAFEWADGLMHFDGVGWGGYFTPVNANGNSWDCSITCDPVYGSNISNRGHFDSSKAGSGTIEYTIIRDGFGVAINSYINLFEGSTLILTIGTGGQDSGTYNRTFTTQGGGLDLHINAAFTEPGNGNHFEIKGTINPP
jgi:hypothetical protein